MLGTILKRLRLSRNLQQKDLVEFLRVAKSTYSQYESDKSMPDVDTLKKLANFYNVSLDYLLDNNYVSEESDTYDFNQRKDMIKTELGNVGVLFYDDRKLTPEQLKILKAVADSMKEDDADKK